MADEVKNKNNKTLSKKRMELLEKLGFFMSLCFNGKLDFSVSYTDIIFKGGLGRLLNYPRSKHLMKNTGDEEYDRERDFMNTFFEFGANKMFVYQNLNRVLEYLEKNYNLVIDDESHDNGCTGKTETDPRRSGFQTPTGTFGTLVAAKTFRCRLQICTCM